MTATHIALLLAALATVGARIEVPRISQILPTALPKEFTNILNGTMNVTLPDVMYFPDDEGELQPGRIRGQALWVPPVQTDDVFFRLFTRDGPEEGEIIELGVEDSLRNSAFNASQHTFLVTHGFTQSIESNTIRTIKNMYVPYRGGNFIAVDWSKISKNLLYFVVKTQTYQVGELVGAFVAFLVNNGGADLSHVHLCGHSLGAHVMGVAGKNVSATLGRKVGRITGLDPAGPLFSVTDKPRRLDRGDAEFVDVIHTCAGWLGLPAPIGHVDFYPNGGTMRQPGCSWDFATAGTCSHSRSWEFFAESVNTHRFSSRACSSYPDYLLKNCNDAPKVPMGQHTPKSTVGTYFLETAEVSPYAMG